MSLTYFKVNMCQFPNSGLMSTWKLASYPLQYMPLGCSCKQSSDLGYALET